MDPEMSSTLVQMAGSLAALAAKGTATAVYAKVKSVQSEKNADTIRATYDEVISQLLSEREEAIRFAQAYKEELERTEISDEDIDSLHNTVTSVLSIIKRMSPDAKNVSSLEQLNDLISVDTLKTVQLLGFNYKAAIGEPLTRLCANAIENLGKEHN